MIHRVPLPSSRLKPWGLIGALVLILLVERFGMHNNTAFLSQHAANWQFADRYVESRSRESAILCFGDSLLKYGMFPPVLKARTGLSAYNFAVSLGPAPASYFLFRRALEQGARPKAVVVDFVNGIQQEGPNSQLLIYPWADLLRAREAFDLAWQSGQADLFTRTMVGRLLPTYKARFEIREQILACLQGVANHRAAVIAIMRQNWLRNHGAQANFKSAFRESGPPAGPERSQWRCHPINETYIRRFMALASDHKIPVYWIIPPIAPMAQRHNTYRGADRRYDEFVKRVQTSFANLVVVDGRASGLDRTYFIDDRHLDHEGGTALSAGVGDVVVRHLSESAGRHRWITLTGIASKPVAIANQEGQGSLSVLRPRKRR